jgi:hypothetical protein
VFCSNLFTSVIVAPFVVVMSAVSLSALQRAMEWISSIAKGNNLKGWMKDVKPYAKNIDLFLERVMGGNIYIRYTTLTLFKKLLY